MSIFNNWIVICIYSYGVTLFLFSLNFKSFLTSLLMLELLVLHLFLLVCLLCLLKSFSSYIMFFLVVVVCEGSLGLSLLMTMIRLNGSSMMKMSNFFMC